MSLRRPLRLHRSGDLGTWEKELVSAFHSCSPPYSEIQTLADKREGFRRISRIVQSANNTQLNELELKHLMWSALGLCCYFRLQYTGTEKVLLQCTRRRDYERSQRLYMEIVQRLLLGGQETEVIESILSYFSEYKIWSREFLAIGLLLRPVAAGATGSLVLGRMLDRVQETLGRKSHETRQIIRVLYEILDFYFWPPVDFAAAKAITRLLKMYRIGVRVEHDDQLCREVTGGPLRKGLEVAIRRIIEHMTNSDLMLIVGYMAEWVFNERFSDENILDFGTVIEHAAMVHVTELYSDTFTHELFDILLEIVGSERSAVSQLGNRILHHLLDRHDNRHQFESPKIFFQNTHFNVTVSKFFTEDRIFLKRHRAKIHESLMHAIVNHAAHRANLENIFTTICLLATEVPCGYTAAALTNLVMNVQAAARHDVNFRLQVQYHLHAFTIGVMSLLCWLHNAPDFYKYVNKIINMRAEQAPHLNPPLRISYAFAQHHVLWDKAELFFNDWEVRYSLWMRFKIKATQTFLESKQAAGPPTTEAISTALESGNDPSLAAHVAKPTRRQQLRPFLPVPTGGVLLASELPEQEFNEHDSALMSN